MSKKINAALKRAYYYFGFKEVASYNEVNKNIQKLRSFINHISLPILPVAYDSKLLSYLFLKTLGPQGYVLKCKSSNLG